jgi:hypothetical protein
MYHEVWGRRDGGGKFRLFLLSFCEGWKGQGGGRRRDMSSTGTDRGMTHAASKGAIEQGNRANTHLSVTLKVPSEPPHISRGFTTYNEQSSNAASE